jgi:hypothetical protein
MASSTLSARSLLCVLEIPLLTAAYYCFMGAIYARCRSLYGAATNEVYAEFFMATVVMLDASALFISRLFDPVTGAVVITGPNSAQVICTSREYSTMLWATGILKGLFFFRCFVAANRVRRLPDADVVMHGHKNENRQMSNAVFVFALFCLVSALAYGFSSDTSTQFTVWASLLLLGVIIILFIVFVPRLLLAGAIKADAPLKRTDADSPTGAGALDAKHVDVAVKSDTPVAAPAPAAEATKPKKKKSIIKTA